MTRREPRREHGRRPDRTSEERSLDALLAGDPLPDDEPARWWPVAEVLTALTSAPESSELSGEARALAEFRARARVRARTRTRAGRQRARSRRQSRVTGLRLPRPAVAAAGGAVLVGGLLAVAYAGDLPAAAQRLAHATIDAPAAGESASAGPAAPAPSPDASHLPGEAVRTSSPSDHGPARPDRRGAGVSRPGLQRHSRPFISATSPASGSPSGSPGPGSPGQGSPGQGSPDQGSPGPSGGSPSDSPAPTQGPSPRASIAPSASPSPSPAPSSPP